MPSPYRRERVKQRKTAQQEVSAPYILPVNKQISSLNQQQLLVAGLWSISRSVLKTLSTFPYLSQTRFSILPTVLLHVGHRAQTLPAASPASPPRCPLPLLSRCIRTRPSRTALSSEANTNQPQMFMLGEKEQQMQSHSIKLASLPLSLCLPLFPTFFFPFCKSAKRERKKKKPGELFRSVGVTSFSLRLCLIFQLLLSHLGFPLKMLFPKRNQNNPSSSKLTDTGWSRPTLIIKQPNIICRTFPEVFCARSSPFIRENVSTPES